MPALEYLRENQSRGRKALAEAKEESRSLGSRQGLETSLELEREPKGEGKIERPFSEEELEVEERRNAVSELSLPEHFLKNRRKEVVIDLFSTKLYPSKGQHILHLSGDSFETKNRRL